MKENKSNVKPDLNVRKPQGDVSGHKNESTNSCMDEPNAKNAASTELEKATRNVQTLLPQEQPIPEEEGKIEKDTAHHMNEEPKEAGVEVTNDQDKKSSSTEKVNFEDTESYEEDSSARSGGSSIPPVSSTSKLSADAGISQEDFKKLHETNPDAALALLIKSRSSSNSTASDPDVRSKVEHDALILRFTREYIQDDAFQALEANPKAIYSMKAFLNKLQ
ncbi:protein gar2-like, partial [Trifolium medium]|nr:protein gar2-like [Trifolium medium]